MRRPKGRFVFLLVLVLGVAVLAGPELRAGGRLAVDWPTLVAHAGWLAAASARIIAAGYRQSPEIILGLGAALAVPLVALAGRIAHAPSRRRAARAALARQMEERL